MKYNTIFFDLDDTLVDTEKNNREALSEIFTDQKYDNYFCNFDEFHQKYKSINNELWSLYAQHKITKEILQTTRFKNTLSGIIDLTNKQSLSINNDFMQKTQSKKNRIEGAIEILDYLYPKYKLYILSNGFSGVQDQKIKNADLDIYFKQVILSDQIGINKPDSRIFCHALSISETSTEYSIMIGDNLKTDIIGAKNSNIDQVWYNPHELIDEENINPTFTIKSLMDLKKIL